MTKTFIALAVFIFIIIVGAIILRAPEVTVNSTSQSNFEGAATVDPVEEQADTAARVLNLSSQRLEQTPGYVFEEVGLIELDLSGNQLRGSLPGEIRFLKDLRVLNLSNNQFTGLPAEIGQLENLEVLNVANNQLTGLPHELANLKNLRLLNLSGNEYSTDDFEIIKRGLPASVVIQTE